MERICVCLSYVFFFKQKTASEMRISDWSSDVCSSDLTAVSEETKGPRTSAPPQALEGFLRKTGLSQDQLVDRDGVWFAVQEKPGRKIADVLAEAIPAIVRAFPWPKAMRWGAASASTESLRWVRPLQGIVALLGGAVVPFEKTGRASWRERGGQD